MDARLNPLAQVPFAIAKGVRKNTGVLVFNVRNEDMVSRDVQTYSFRRTIWLLNPEPISEYLIAAGQYLAGDLKVYFPALSLQNAIKEVADDDPKGAVKPLSEFREFNGLNGGVDVAKDILEFGGIRYRILQMFPENIWRNVPNQFKAVCRRM